MDFYIKNARGNIKKEKEEEEEEEEEGKEYKSDTTTR